MIDIEAGVEIVFDNKKIVSAKNLEGDLKDWSTSCGSWQVFMSNPNYKFGIKTSMTGHCDSYRLQRCEGMATWEPERRHLDLKKVDLAETYKTWSLFQFMYEGGFGPQPGRIFRAKYNNNENEILWTFEIEVLNWIPWHEWVTQRPELIEADPDDVNEWVFNHHLAEGGFVKYFVDADALLDPLHNFVIAPDAFTRNGYKAETSIFTSKDGIPQCFDIDSRTVNAYFKPEWIEATLAKYKPLYESLTYHNEF
jgi:hypothetical protein